TVSCRRFQTSAPTNMAVHSKNPSAFLCPFHERDALLSPRQSPWAPALPEAICATAGLRPMNAGGVQRPVRGRASILFAFHPAALPPISATRRNLVTTCRSQPELKKRPVLRLAR